MPCEANAAVQTAILTELTALVADVAAGEALLCRRGPSHPRSTRARCPTGKARALLPVSSRERVNLHAALNAHAPTQVHLDEIERVDAQSTRWLYEKLLAAHPDQARICVICDNARYYKKRGLVS